MYDGETCLGGGVIAAVRPVERTVRFRQAA
jgi:hypothetical protein